MNIQEIRKKIDQHLAQLSIAREQVKKEKEALIQVEQRVSTIKEAQQVTQQIAQQVQQQAHNQIANIVSKSLSAIFDEPYQFKIHFERKRGKTEARLVFERDGMEVDPMTASGGGVVDVAAFALRLSCLLLSQPPVMPVLILDEPFKYVSAEYRGRVRNLLESLSKEQGVQIIMVTHIPELKTGKVIQIGNN